VNRNQSTTVPPVQLGKYGQISGRVTNEFGEPIAGAEIYAYNTYKDASGNAGWSGFQFVLADQNGYYRFDRLLPRLYRLYATYRSDGPYHSEFYNNVTTFVEATDVEVVVDGVVANIDFALRAKKQVSGKVTDEAGNPLANVPVTVMQQRESGWHSVTQAVTDSNGRYALDGLAPGSYYIRFTSPLYEWEYYNNAATAEQATPIVVQAGASLTGLDANELTAPGASGVGKEPVVPVTPLRRVAIRHEPVKRAEEILRRVDHDGTREGKAILRLDLLQGLVEQWCLARARALRKAMCLVTHNEVYVLDLRPINKPEALVVDE
jgi:protocatechuate 3,4-dioxygenase beta subunit